MLSHDPFLLAKQAILVLNCGSSSVKFAVVTTEDMAVVLSGLAASLGSSAAVITLKQNGEKITHGIANANHDIALAKIVELLQVETAYEVVAVGHRVVHGGEVFSESCLIDETVKAEIAACIKLAPLHNPAHIAGIEAAQKAYPTLPQVAVFDSAFHQTLPETAYLYAVPYHYYKQYGVRRYGFHGTSYRYIKQAVPDFNHGVLPEKLLVAHLGNGASVCAIQNGQSVQTSMGLTPLDGLVQGTRSGVIDPAIIAHIADSSDNSYAEIIDALWKQSGLLGLSGCTNDCRELEVLASQGHVAARRSLNVFVARLCECVGSYAATMNGLDAIAFTGGIGENSTWVRQKVLANLTYLGFAADDAKNISMVRGLAGDISARDSKPVWVIPANEEVMIAKDTLNIM